MSVRRVRRIIRKIDPWTVLKISLALNAIGALVWVLGVWIAWSIAIQRGIPDAFVDLFAQLTIAVTPDGELYFRVVVMSAIVWVIVTTAAFTLAAVLYNLISDIVGGIELTMLEEIPDTPMTSEPRRPRPVVHVPANGAGTSTLSVEETVEQTSGV
ncbi:MAG: DUF3566 domain-containing protein [Actinomycetia bacterium]|nr:DUF3566 domain-containing protein [Actinomycetes bacterium]